MTQKKKTKNPPGPNGPSSSRQANQPTVQAKGEGQPKQQTKANQQQAKPNQQQTNKGQNSKSKNQNKISKTIEKEPEIPTEPIVAKDAVDEISTKVAELTLTYKKCFHIPAALRLKHIILFKQMQPFYCEDIVKTSIMKEDLTEEKSIFNVISELIKSGNKKMILDVINSVYESSNHLLINYDIIMYCLALCLDKVRQDPKQKLPSDDIIKFRKEVISLAVLKISAQNSERFLMFVFSILSINKKILNCDSVRKILISWYQTKECDQLLKLVIKHPSYRSLKHDKILKFIHLGITKNISPDRELTILTLYFGFNVISYRLEQGKFKNEKCPDFLKNSPCFETASSEIKKIIIDLASISKTTSKPVNIASNVKVYQLSISNVPNTMKRNYKINYALLETMTSRELLQNMKRLSKDELLWESALSNGMEIKPNATADLFNVRLDESSEPPIHPVEVYIALSEYVTARKRIRELQDKIQKKQPAAFRREPLPTVVNALNSLYTKSYENFSKIDREIVIIIDLQPEFKDKICYTNQHLKAKDVMMLMVNYFIKTNVLGDKCRIFYFGEERKPITELKLHSKLEDDDETKEKCQTDSDAFWKYYHDQTTKKPTSVTYHKIFSYFLKQTKQPDLFVVISDVNNISLFKARRYFTSYMEKTKQTNTQLITFNPGNILPMNRPLQRKNMLYVVGCSSNITHVIQEFLTGKIDPPVTPKTIPG